VRERDLVLLSLAAACGALSHYHFGILVATAIVFWSIRLWKRDRRRVAYVLGAVLAGTMLFAVIHPGFWRSVQEAGRRTQPYQASQVEVRAERVVERYASSVIDPRVLSREHSLRVAAVIVGVLVLLFFVGLYRSWQRPESNGEPAAAITSDELSVLYFLFILAGSNIALYMLFRSPSHAMSAKYPVMVWPFLAVLPVLALRGRTWRGLTAATVFACVVFVGGVFCLRDTAKYNRVFGTPESLLKVHPRVLTDDTGMGGLPRVLWFCPDATLVYSAPQEFLAYESDDWLFGIVPRTLYVAAKTRGNKGGDVVAITDKIGRRFRLSRLDGPFWDLGVGAIVGEQHRVRAAAP
jgi:hypothetical protein